MSKEAFNERVADPSVRLVEITGAPEHAHLVRQLVGNDDVHDFGTESTFALSKYRLGGDLFVKTAFGLTDASMSTLYAAIYVYKTPKAIHSFDDVPGNVGHILNQPSLNPLHNHPNALVFYSITSISDADNQPLKKGAGGMLIAALLKEGKWPNAVLSTLSPLRTLGKSFVRSEGEALSDAQRLALAYLHLHEVTNPVQKFHMGNGATIGDIKLRATLNPFMPDYRHGLNVMVNYRYPSDAQERDENRALFAAIRAGTAAPGALCQLFESNVLGRVDAAGHAVEAMAPRLTGRGQPLAVPA